jgi:transketolase
MRAMPNVTVLAPADEHETRAVIRWSANHEGPVYLRLARDAVDDVFDESYRFDPRLPRLLHEGEDVVVITTGAQASRTLAAVRLLEADGIAARLIHLPMLKPIDEMALRDAVGGNPIVITVEEHSVIGGLGGLVSEIVTGADHPPRVIRIGLADKWSESAPNDFLLEKYGLSATRVAEQIRAALHRG